MAVMVAGVTSMLALAIDLGMLQTARREAQRAADAVAGDDEQFARFLRNRARDLLTDDYEAGDAAWLKIGKQRLIVGRGLVLDPRASGTARRGRSRRRRERSGRERSSGETRAWVWPTED